MATADASAYLSMMISIFSKLETAETVCMIVPNLSDMHVLLPALNSLALRSNWQKYTAGVKDIQSVISPEGA